MKWPSPPACGEVALRYPKSRKTIHRHPSPLSDVWLLLSERPLDRLAESDRSDRVALALNVRNDEL
jgi:hypothetical protein